MKPFRNKLAVTIVVLSVAFFGIIIFTLSKQNSAIASGVGTVVSPLQKIIYKVNDKSKSTVDFFLNFSKVKEENEALKTENIELKNKLIEYNRMKEENTSLREVLKYAESKSNYQYVGVDIIGYSGGNISDGYVIDKGTKDGVAKDMVVITAEGLVGKVTRSESNYSIVQSIINENIAVSVMVESTRETTGILRGIGDGKNKNLIQINNLPVNSEIKVGDVILTSGLGMVYPKEIRVGEVLSVETDNVRVMKNAIVKPYVDFNKLEELFIVIPNDKIDMKYN